MSDKEDRPRDDDEDDVLARWAEDLPSSFGDGDTAVGRPLAEISGADAAERDQQVLRLWRARVREVLGRLDLREDPPCILDVLREPMNEIHHPIQVASAGEEPTFVGVVGDQSLMDELKRVLKGRRCASLSPCDRCPEAWRHGGWE